MSTTTQAIQSSILKVPGAQLYYEVQGSGPLLLMIPASSMVLRWIRTWMCMATTLCG